MHQLSSYMISVAFSGEVEAPPSIPSLSEQHVLAAQARLKRFPVPSMSISAAAIKPHSASGSSFAEKMITVANNVSCLSCVDCENLLMFY